MFVSRWSGFGRTGQVAAMAIQQSYDQKISPFYSPDRGAGGVLSLGRGSPLRLFIATSERIWVGAGG
jgi:hypothetical protein